jgi:hypothetical protein
MESPKPRATTSSLREPRSGQSHLASFEPLAGIAATRLRKRTYLAPYCTVSVNPILTVFDPELAVTVRG